MRTNSIVDALGYDPRDRLLIIHADDIGMCHAVNEALREAVSKELVTSCSVMAPCPWIVEACELLKDLELDSGAHLTLNSEWKLYRWGPVADNVVSLRDPEGFMWSSVAQVVARAKYQEVRKELEAQVHRILALGLALSHMDSHMGALFARSDLFKAYLEVADKFRLIPMLVNPTSSISRKAREEGYPLDQLAEMILNSPWPKLDELLPGLPRGTWEDKLRSLRTFLKGVRGGSVVQVIVHLAIDSPEIKAIMPGSYSSRVHEFKLVTSEELRRLLEQLGFQLVSWKELVRALGHKGQSSSFTLER